MKKKGALRTAVLDAAVDLVETSGVALLTLDAVAARAGVSKGGLLHHFRSKEALLTAMIGRVADTFEEEWRQAVQRVGNDGGTKAAENELELISTYLDRSFSGLGTRNRNAMALFAVAANQPELLQPIRDYFHRRALETLAHSGHPQAILTLMLLADGLWLFDALGIEPFSGELRKSVHQFVTDFVRYELRSKLQASVLAAETFVEPKKKRSKPEAQI